MTREKVKWKKCIIELRYNNNKNWQNSESWTRPVRLKLEGEYSLSREPKRIQSESWLHIICINFHFAFFADNLRECATLNAVLWRNFQATYFYWIKVGVFFKRNSFIREDAAFCFVVYFDFILVQFVSRNIIFFRSQTQFSKRMGDC